MPLVFDSQEKVYRNEGINFESLSHLDSIGLIQSKHAGHLTLFGLPQQYTASYYGKMLELTLEKETDNELVVGCVMLTQVGQELAPICGGKPVDGFMDYVKEKWKKHLPKDEDIVKEAE